MNVRTSATHRLLEASGLAAAVLTIAIGIASANQDDSQRGGQSYTIGLFGDTPYNALGRAQYPSLLADINASHVAFSVFDGDLKPGGDGPYPENVRWKFGPVVYIGLNVQGSNDNYPYFGVDGETRSPAEIARMRAEETARKAADLAWLHDGFAYAKRVGAQGVMVLQQADLNFNNEQHLTDPRSYDAFADYISALRAETLAFDGQVALVHGDSHYFKMDKPLNGPAGGVLANFTRVETFGACNTHWVAAHVDPTDRNLFIFEPRIVPANAD